MSDLKDKKVVLVIAHQMFRDEEYAHPKEVLESYGIKVITASSQLSPAKGRFGLVAHPDVLLKDVKLDDFDAIAFIGGPGAEEYWDDPKAHQLANEALAAGKLVGAICIAPVTLARAGVLREKKATVFPSEIENIKHEGALYTGSGVEQDGRLITANGPESAREFGEALAKALGG